MSDEELASAPIDYRDGLFQDKTIIIAGGGSGMGRAMAYIFARLGANVAICGRRAEKLEETRDGVKRLVGKDIDIRAMSIRDSDMAETFVARCFDRFGGVDALINSAGGQYPQMAIDYTRNGWNAVIDTNLNGQWWMMQEVAKHWRNSGSGGSIINIVAHVENGMPQSASSCAARAGVIYLSRTLSIEWAEYGIRVNCIAPGAIATDGLNVYEEELIHDFHKANPMKRLGDVWDIAQAAVYLAGPTGRYVTGQILTVDGGMGHYGWVWPGGKPDYFKD